MTPDAHNLLTHHCGDLRSMAPNWKKRGDFGLAQCYAEFEHLLRIAQVFRIPDAGRITGIANPFAEFHKMMVEDEKLIRLPYPVTCVEFEPGNAYEKTVGDYTPKSLLATAIEGDLFRERMQKFAKPDYPAGAAMFMEAKIFVVCTHEFDGLARAHARASGYECRTSFPLTWHGLGFSAAYCERAGLMTQGGAPVGHGWLDQRSSRKYITGDELNALNQIGGEEHRECFAIVDLLLALSCSNVTISRLPSALSESAKRRREAKGKPKFYDYHILEITGASDRAEGSGESHASPRLHLRRGHIRRLHDSGRRIWVNACVVGKPESGVLLKDYDARPLSISMGAIT